MPEKIEFSTSIGNCSAAFCNNCIDPRAFIENSSERCLGTASSHLAVLADFHSNGVPTGRQKLAGARRGFRRAPLVTRQPAYKPGSGWHAGVPAYVTAIPLGRRLPGASSNLPERPDLDTIPKRFVLARKAFAPFLFGLAPGGVCRAAGVTASAVRCYRTVSPLPSPPVAGRSRRSVLCGTIPGLAPAGRYPAPFVHGARTFLPGNLSVLPERPSGRLTQQGMGSLSAAVKRPNFTRRSPSDRS